MTGRATPEEIGRRVHEFIDLHDILDPDPQHDEAWGEFVFMAWMLEADDYERIGGEGADVSTEDLRVAMQRYRSFFDRLLRA